MKKKLLLLVLLTATILRGQTVTVSETLLDSQGSNLQGTLQITNAAMILPTGSTATVSTCSNATPIQLDTTTAHGWTTGWTVYVTGVTGNTACNGTWTVTVVDTDSATLDGSAGNGTYVSGGTAQRRINVGAKTVVYPSSGTFNGTITVSLYPTTTAEAVPGGGAAGFTYRVAYILTNGVSFVERWNIPPTPTQTTISAVRSPGTVNPTATINLSQLSGSGATDTRNAKVTWIGSQAAWYLTDYPVNTQTGTSYTVLDSDRMKVIRHSNTAAIADTLPQAGASSQFVAGWQATFCNDNTGEVTITPTTSTIDGQTTLKLRVGMCSTIWSDGTNYFSTGPGPGTAGANFANITRSLFTSTANATVASSVSETSIIGTGVGTKTLPINFHDAAGSSIRVYASGYYSNTGTPTLTVKLKYGATAIPTGGTGAITTTTGATNWLWIFDGVVTCRTTGTSGTVIMQGEFRIQTGATAWDIYPMLSTATTTINTTVTNAVDLTVQWGTSSASNTITGTNFIMYPVSTPL